jgi:hypothetical protein
MRLSFRLKNNCFIQTHGFLCCIPTYHPFDVIVGISPQLGRPECASISNLLVSDGDDRAPFGSPQS